MIPFLYKDSFGDLAFLNMIKCHHGLVRLLWLYKLCQYFTMSCIQLALDKLTDIVTANIRWLITPSIWLGHVKQLLSSVDLDLDREFVSDKNLDGSRGK